MSQVKIKPIMGQRVPTCARGCSSPDFQLFADTAGLEHNLPSQLTEFTLGAVNPGPTMLVLVNNNVDIDVSYVDDAHLPVAMEPFGNPDVGYVGMVSSVEDFKAALKKFISKKNPKSPYRGWPRYVDMHKDKLLKLPSPIQIYGRDLNKPQPDLTKPPWRPFTNMESAWNKCDDTSNTTRFCNKLRAVLKLFNANYKNYSDNFKSLGCKGKPDELTVLLMRRHVHGWTPFIENCPPTANLLENTPGYKANNSAKYQRIKIKFDALQNKYSGRFNPYVLLIHSKKYVNAPNVYAYSVDDGVGNLQADGTGLIIAVGGKRGLPNPDPVTPPVNVNFGYSTKDHYRFVKFGVCSEVPDQDVNPSYPSFPISATKIENCTITLLDNSQTLYTIHVTKQPPYHSENHVVPPEPIKCTVQHSMKGQQWCDAIFAYTDHPKGQAQPANFVITPPAIQDR